MNTSHKEFFGPRSKLDGELQLQTNCQQAPSDFAAHSLDDLFIEPIGVAMFRWAFVGAVCVAFCRRTHGFGLAQLAGDFGVLRGGAMVSKLRRQLSNRSYLQRPWKPARLAPTISPGTSQKVRIVAEKGQNHVPTQRQQSKGHWLESVFPFGGSNLSLQRATRGDGFIDRYEIDIPGEARNRCSSSKLNCNRVPALKPANNSPNTITLRPIAIARSMISSASASPEGASKPHRRWCR